MAVLFCTNLHVGSGTPETIHLLGLCGHTYSFCRLLVLGKPLGCKKKHYGVTCDVSCSGKLGCHSCLNFLNYHYLDWALFDWSFEPNATKAAFDTNWQHHCKSVWSQEDPKSSKGYKIEFWPQNIHHHFITQCNWVFLVRSLSAPLLASLFAQVLTNTHYDLKKAKEKNKTKTLSKAPLRLAANLFPR